MKKAYYIAPEHRIESDENGNFNLMDLNIALAIVGGWNVGSLTPLEDMLMLRAGPQGEETCFIPATTDGETIQKHANTYGIHPLNPLASLEFAQALMANFPCVVTPVISQGGALRGVWAVESVGAWNGANILMSGARNGAAEFVETASMNLAEAIGLNVLNRIGIGKEAWFYYPDMSVENGELMYFSERTHKVIQSDADFMAHLVRVPELDEYAVIGAPADLIAEAAKVADAQAVLQKEPLKQRQLEAEAAAAAAEEQAEPETVANDDPELVESEGE
ncbi:TPA: hypothetical protein JG832_002404 [Enterobacter hormaechei subsp. xiangfangensis]|nr:hypothetical protein [Enterobacter hormaechei subsp. xiangfangensis]HAV1890542.1 hypothetical protein [Enterobacter hormaechei subsp. xiangfangensis]